MRILILGVGAIGSNLTARLASDLRTHDITILDKDVVEERNITAGTQFFYPDQIGLPKVEALQFNIYKWYGKEINILHEELKIDTLSGMVLKLPKSDIIIDCLDNWAARDAVQSSFMTSTSADMLHVGFSDQMTFAIEWAERYKPPTDISSGFDLCTMQGASSFINMVSSLSSLVVQRFINSGSKIDIIGNSFSHHIVN